MVITTEQEAINQFWPNDNTKTIEDLINVWVNDFNMSREDSINTIKNISYFSNVTNWSV